MLLEWVDMRVGWISGWGRNERGAMLLGLRDTEEEKRKG